MSSSPLITQTAEYALRAMSCLAGRGDDFARAEDISESARVPRAYLSKILRKMVVAGLVEGKRGHHGGFRLARAPKNITLQDVLAAVDALPTNECAFGHAACDKRHPCPLHDSWMDLKSTYLTWMNRHTLADASDSGEYCS